MTVAVGNLVVVIVAEAKMVDNQVYEYLIFLGLLAFATLVFAIISYFYKYVEDHKHDEDKSSDSSSDTGKKIGIANVSYTKDADNDEQLVNVMAFDPN
jgi:hypothetical protein